MSSLIPDTLGGPGRAASLLSTLALLAVIRLLGEDERRAPMRGEKMPMRPRLA